jgi:copper resistance protein D
VLDWAAVAARFFQLASVLTLFGSALFVLYANPAGVAQGRAAAARRTWPRSGWVLAALIGVGSTLAWLAAEAASLTGDWTAIGTVVRETRFGHVMAARAGLLTLCLFACLFGRSERPLAVIVSAIGAAAVASIAWTGHGAMNSGPAGLRHLGADVLHLMTAGIWVGALLALAVPLTRSAHLQSAAEAERIARALARFSAIGPAVVALLVLTGLINSWYLIGLAHWTAIFTSAYGLALLAKVALFIGMLAIAAMNRFRLAPALERTLAAAASTQAALGSLRRSLMTECTLALLVLALVAVLGALEPPLSAQ